MNTINMIKEIEKLVENACKKESNMFGYSIWSHHIKYVVKFAKQLAKILNADSEIVEIAALLHDYAAIKDKKYHKEHHIHGAQMAEEILQKFNYPQDKIEKVKECIFAHRGSVVIEKTKPEQECVASADAMAHINQVIPLLYLIYKKKNMNIDEGKLWLQNKLKRTHNKLCPEAKEIIKEKYYCAQKVLE